MKHLDNELIHAVRRMAALTGRRDLDHQEKLQYLLQEMVQLMDVEKGTIMIFSGRKYLEVKASTTPGLIGVKQSIESESPSAWVFKNKKTLYVDRDNPFKSSKSAEKRKYKKEAYLLAPILRGQKAIGVIGVTDKKGGDLFSEEEQSLLFDLAGQMISDIENYRLTESLKKKKRELQKKNEQLRHLEKLREELYHMLIHDLKGPLSSVVANLDILSYTVKGEDHEYVSEAQADCDTLFRMTSDLLDVARLEEGRLNLIYEKIRPDQLAAEALSRVVGVARGYDVSVEITPGDDVGATAFDGDRGILLRVLQNLIMNAVHHSRRGDTLKVVFGRTEKADIRFQVYDHGPGVTKEHQETIFDKFFQVDDKNRGTQYSTGLGLTFCKMAVEAHGGSIGVESDGKTGSCFWFRLPLSNK